MSMIDLRWAWQFQGAPADLWRWASDTDFIDRAAGLSAVTYAWEPLPGGGRRRVATSRFGPLRTQWVEHPFVWEEGTRLSVRRTFIGGPARELLSTVTLEPAAGGGTRLVHEIRLEPRNALLAPILRAMFAPLEAAFERAYRLADEAARLEAVDRELGAPQPAVLAGLAGEGVEPSLAARLAAYVAHGPERKVEHLRPFALADAWGVPRPTMLAACLAGCRAGVLEARWGLRCPHCRGAKGVASTLAGLEAESACEDCQARFGGSLDRTAELAFRPVPAVRQLDGAIYCLAGPAATPHVLARAELAPGERRALEVSSAAVQVMVADRCAGLAYLDPTAGAGVAAVVDLAAAEPVDACSGGDQLALVLTNRGEAPLPFQVESLDGVDASCPVASALAHPDFARTFPAAALADGRRFEVETLAVVAWRGPAPGEPPAGGFAARGPEDQPAWAFYDPLDALEAALGLVQPDRAIAVAGGPAGASGSKSQVPTLDGPAARAASLAAAHAVEGTLVLGAAIAADDALLLRLAAAGWAELAVAEDGTTAFAPAEAWADVTG